MVFSCFLDDFWLSDLKRVLNWNLGSFWEPAKPSKTLTNMKKHGK